MMGNEDDPSDGKAVASSIFIAVAVYGVSASLASFFAIYLYT